MSAVLPQPDPTVRPAPEVERATLTATGLRELADLIEENPILVDNHLSVWVLPRAHNAAEFAAMCKAIGTGTKNASTHDLEFRRTFTGGVNIEVSVSKEQTCERVVVGKRTVEREVYPDDVTPTIELVEEDVTEWRCPPSFLALADEQDGTT